MITCKIMNLGNYLTIARFDHWFKNIFVLPGTLIAALLTHTPVYQFIWPLLFGISSTCLISSANYVINEWLDAETDRFHPVKKNRPSVNGKIKSPFVYVEYAIFSVAGLGFATLISPYFLATAVIFLFMGIIYNVRPLRTKDKVYLDVLSESFNNPIRLALGWFVVTSYPMPPSSLVMGFWMGGAFLMAVKRYAELRFINYCKKGEKAHLYRQSFNFYNNDNLLIASFFYAICSFFFLGVFLIKHRIELLLSLPFFVILFTWYLYIGMKHNSPTQNPERLFSEKFFIIYVIFLVNLVGILSVFEISWIHWFLKDPFEAYSLAKGG